MATELTIDSTSTATATLVGAWELRAGSHDTTDYLNRGSTYPGNLESFKPLQSDATNGYAPAPKMALITFTGGADGETILLGGGISSILTVFIQENDATPVAAGHASNNMALDVSRSGTTLTLQITGGASDVIGDIMVLYN